MHQPGVLKRMPIYEFYCRRCNTIYSFFSAGVAPDARPSCPRCVQERLEKRPSTFATLKHRGESDEDPLGHLDEDKLEGAMAALTREVEQLGDSEDPQHLGRLFRRFGEMTGLEVGPRMEDALRRLEAGEDLESLEADMEGDLEGDDSLEDLFQFKKATERRRQRPRVDDTLYFL